MTKLKDRKIFAPISGLWKDITWPGLGYHIQLTLNKASYAEGGQEFTFQTARVLRRQLSWELADLPWSLMFKRARWYFSENWVNLLEQGWLKYQKMSPASQRCLPGPDQTEKAKTMSFSSHQRQVKDQKQLGTQRMSPQRPEEKRHSNPVTLCPDASR